MTDTPGSPAPTAAKAPPPVDSGGAALGIASIVLSAAAMAAFVVMLLVKLALPLFKAFPNAAQTILALCFFAACGAALLGLSLAAGAYVRAGAEKTLAVVGLVLNGGFLAMLAVMFALGMAVLLRAVARRAAAPQAAAARMQAANAARAQVEASAQAGIQRRLSAEMTDAAREGYSRASVTDLVADPAKYSGARVYFSGFYSGISPDIFFIWGRFGGGGNVRVDGSRLSVDKKRAMVDGLDGFHEVLVKGVFETRGKSGVLLRADDVEDLGRDPAPLTNGG